MFGGLERSVEQVREAMSMKSSRKILVLVLVIVAIILSVWWFLSDRQETARKSGAEMTNEWRAKLTEAEQKKGAPLTGDETLALLPRGMANTIKTASQMDVEEVAFYVHVVDQYNSPVSNTVIRYSIMGSMLGGYTPGRVASDAQGNQRIAGKGGGITIMGVERPGYVFLGMECYGGPNCSFDETDFFAAIDKQPNEKTWYDHKTPETAYVMRVHRLGAVAGVKGERMSIAPREVNRWQTYQLAPKKMRTDDENQDGHIRVRLLDDSDDNWTVEIQAIDGGLLEAPKEDAYMAVAPESGYQDTYIFDCRRDGHCNAGNSRRFYFYTHGGKEYGAMVVSIGKGVRGRYRINTQGGRDLNMADIKDFDLNGVYR